MIAFYLLVSVMPFIQHPLWSLFIGSLTLVKILGLVCVGYALLYGTMRPTSPWYFRTWQARLAIALCVIGLGSDLTMGSRLPIEISPTLSYASFLALFIVTLNLVDSVHRLRWVLLVATGSMGYASLHIIREWQKSGFDFGYRPGWVTGDPNYFSLSALLALPFAFYLLRPRQPRWERYFCLVCLGLTLIGLTLAASRGALLGLAASVLLAAWRSRHRTKILIGAVALLLPLMALSPSSPLGRLLNPTFSDRDSTESRLVVWAAGIRMIQSNPILGVGAGNFKPSLPRFLNRGESINLIAHNTYIGIGAELGLPALAVFVGILVATLRSSERIRRATRQSGPVLVGRAAEAIQVGLVGYAVAIFFVSAEYQKFFWLIVFLSGCLPALVRRRIGSKPWWSRQSSAAFPRESVGEAFQATPAASSAPPGSSAS